MNHNQNAKMKTKAIIWMAVLALADVSFGQQSDAERRLNEEFDRSVAQVIAAYPDFENPESPFFKKLAEMDNALKVAGDPLFNSGEKPMVLARRAAKELGIMPVHANPTAAPEPQAQGAPQGIVAAELPTTKLKLGSPEWKAELEEAWKRLQDYYPDYCDPALLPRTYKFVREWDAWAKVNRPDVYENPMKPIIYCKWQKAVEKQAKEEKAQQAQDLANARAAEPPVWERYVTNTELTRHNRAAVADEIRRQDGEGAAERFLIEKRLKDLEEAERAQNAEEEGDTSGIFIPPTRKLGGGNYQRSGDRIIVDGDRSKGYRIKGNKLYSYPSGQPTHTRGGSMWIPLDPSQPQIRDPER